MGCHVFQVVCLGAGSIATIRTFSIIRFTGKAGVESAPTLPVLLSGGTVPLAPEYMVSSVSVLSSSSGREPGRMARPL